MRAGDGVEVADGSLIDAWSDADGFWLGASCLNSRVASVLRHPSGEVSVVDSCALRVNLDVIRRKKGAGMSNRGERRLRFFLRLVLAGAAGVMMIPQTALAAEADQIAVSATVQKDLDRAELLLDSWEGQGSGLEEARAELDRAIRVAPRSAEAYRLYARYYISSGHLRGDSFEPGSLEAAEKALDTALEIAPDYARAYVLQGHLYRLMGKPLQAKAALQKAEQLGTDDPWLHLNQAELLMQEDRQDAAVALYRKVLATNASPRTNSAAQSGLIAYYNRNDRLADADALYRKKIAAEPTSAWSHGNYASFLLCWRDDAEKAIIEANKALNLMDYGMARLTLAAALYRKWATLALDRNKLADEPFAAARKVHPYGPAMAIEELCGGGLAVLPILEAMLLTGEGERIPAEVAGVLAAEEGGYLPGVFVMEVKASGRDRGRLYLNSETDYRDARNLSVVITPDIEAAFKREHGSAPDEFLAGKKIVVLGAASQVKIYFTDGRGVPSDKYYYQTHVVAAKSAHIRLSE
ncbi:MULTISPECIES: hypothetical protein [unclassified Pseudoxanthomonas]|uniref:hypothetical protein n=1 Tax=unclassified Pseudoxanthomonas TaxID=2645906 RepID=UPI00307878CB